MSTKELLSKIDEISKSHNLDKFLNQVKTELAETKVSIALLGEFSGGKSTLVNAFLGKNLLPVMEKPTSAAIVEVTGSDQLRAKIQSKNNIQDIELSELGDYAIGDKSKTIDKILLEAPENEFINKDIKFIDTPGISSLHKVHDDITYGYLPFIDAALIILNVNLGGSTESLFNFLKTKIISEQQLSKIFYVLNFSDTKSKDEVQKVCEEVRETVSQFNKDPVIVCVSGKYAVEGKIEESNINELKEILVKQVIEQKSKIIDQRYEKILKAKAKDLSVLLKQKLNAINIDTSELDKNLEKVKSEINLLDDEKRKIKDSFSQANESIMSFLTSISDKYASILIDKAINGEQDEIKLQSQKLSDEITYFINKQFNKLGNSMYVNLDGLSDEISLKVRENTEYITQVINTISPILTSLVLAALTGPAGILASEVVAETAVLGLGRIASDAIIKTPPGFWGKIGQSVAGVVKEIDVVNKLLKTGSKYALKDNIREQLNLSLNQNISLFLDEIETKVQDLINEKIITPQKELEIVLEDVRKQRKEHIEDVSKNKEKLQRDITLLEELK